MIVGLIMAIGISLWKSKSFSKNQKVILMVSIIFFPLQWVLALFFYAYNKNSSKFNIKKTNNIFNNLDELKEDGLLTNEEYVLKKEKLISEKKEYNFKKTKEYNQLKSLLDSGVLTSEEFESKTKILLQRNNDLGNEEKTISRNHKESNYLFFILLIITIITLIFYIKNYIFSKKNSESDQPNLIQPPLQVDQNLTNKPQKNETYLEYNLNNQKNNYFVYCSVYFYFYDAKTGENGFEPYLKQEGEYCSQIIELHEDEIPRFNEEFRNQYIFKTYNNGYGTKIDKSTFQIKKFLTYEEALEDKNKSCEIENKVTFFK